MREGCSRARVTDRQLAYDNTQRRHFGVGYRSPVEYL